MWSERFVWYGAGGLLSGLLCLMPALTLADEPTSQPSEESLSKDGLKTLEAFTGRNGVGLMGGFSSGIGLSYRRYVTDQVAVRGAGYVFYRKESINLWSLGISGQYEFRRESKYSLYVLAGIGLAHTVTAVEIDPTNTRHTQTPAFEYVQNTWVLPSAGAGVELGNHDKAGLTYQLEVVVTPFIKNGEYVRVWPLPQVGVHYSF